MLLFYILIFTICCILLYFSGEWVVGGLIRTARFLDWKEFVVAFLVMAFAASLPNLLIGVSSALRGISELSLGDVSGNNLVAMTLAIALASFFAKEGLPAESRTVQTTSVFTMIAAILPLILILDGTLSRFDGFLLLLSFIFYIAWLFSKKERFAKIYNGERIPVVKEFKTFIQDLGKVFFGVILLIVATQGIVVSAQFFAKAFNFPLVLIGILITGFGSALPEVSFAIASARKEETWMILGDLMGAVIVPATLVLGIVALINPIKIPDLSAFAIARFFVMVSAFFFFLCVRTEHKITKKEGIFLLGLYILFLISEIFIK